MRTAQQRLTALALDLPPEDRLALADALIDSVDPPADLDWERAWTDALAARRAAGADAAQPWPEVRARLTAVARRR
jgi:putative addiction module component (TIGR02574 family)